MAKMEDEFREPEESRSTTQVISCLRGLLPVVSVEGLRSEAFPRMAGEAHPRRGGASGGEIYSGVAAAAALDQIARQDIPIRQTCARRAYPLYARDGGRD